MALLVGVLGALLTFFLTLFGATQRGEVQQEAVAALEAVAATFRERARNHWPDPVTTPRTAFEGFEYQVDDLGMLSNPLDPKVNLTMKELQVTLHYTLSQKGQAVEKHYSSQIWVGK